MDGSPCTGEDELKDVVATDDIVDSYTISWDQKLGEGLSGFVRQCVNKETEEVCALKCLPDTQASRLEISLQLRVSASSNIVKILDVFKNTIQLPNSEEPKDMLLVVMEKMSGGELFDRISKKKRFTEREACCVTKQIAQALQHCHNNSIAHRDIKPENLLLKDHGPDMIVKLTDFGFAKIDHGNLTTPHFTPYYVSPQILEASKFQKAVKAGRVPEGCTYTYDKSCDMWSLGVILYIMLCGYPPFYSEVPSQLFSRSMEQKILRGEYDFPAREWGRVSHEAKTIVVRLLNVDSDRRMTVDELLNSAWLNVVEPNDNIDLHDSGIMRNPDKLDKFKAGHAATLHDLRVPEKNAELRSRSFLCNSTFVDKRRLSTPTTASPKWGYQRVSPPPGSSCTEAKREDVFLRQLRDIVGHLLMPQKQNHEEELCVMVQNALKEQPEGSTLPRVIERETWNNEKFGAGLDHLRLAKSVSDIIQNIQRNKRKGSPH
ncbi:MAP kinase-activated protein kinase 5-like [Bolinopsis microptera]|uniref:MAP kinase-activated protein kinase 5-like n=1 Tax=Bolinopsis microptera TaxID=2820187 RepID=UPI0030790785